MTGAIALLCFGSAQATFSLTRWGLEPSLVWPPAGIALAALLLWGNGSVLGIALGVFSFALSLGSVSGLSGWLAGLVAAGATLGSVSQAIAGTWLLKKWGKLERLCTISGVLRFILLGVLISPVVNATIGTVNGAIAGINVWDRFFHDWATFWVGDGVGILIFTPLMLSWLRSRARVRAPVMPLMPFRMMPFRMSPKVLEATVWLILLLSVSYFSFNSFEQFSDHGYYPVEALPLPLIFWAVLRFGQRGTLLGSLIVAVMAIAGSANAAGPFFARAWGDAHQAMLLLQLYIGGITATSLILGAAVAEREQVQVELQRSEARFQSVVESSAVGIAMSDFQGRIIDSNPKFQAMLGYSREELRQLKFTEITHGDDLPEDLAQFERMKRGELESYQLEKRYIHRDGATFWVRLTLSLVRDPVGQPQFMTAVVVDISDRKQAAEQLRRVAESHRLLADFALRIHRSLNVEEILNITAAEVRQFLRADRVTIGHLVGDDRGQNFAESVDPAWPSAMDWVSQPVVVDMLKTMFSQNHIRAVADTSQITAPAPVLPIFQDYYQRYHIRASLNRALRLQGELFGMIAVHQCSGPRQWQDFEIDLLEQLSIQVEIALQQQQLYDQVKNLAGNLEQQVCDRTAELQQRMEELQTVNQQRELLLHAVSHDLRTPVQGMLMVLNHLHKSVPQNQPGEDQFGSSAAVPCPPLMVPAATVNLMLQSCTNQLNLLNSLRQDANPDGESVAAPASSPRDQRLPARAGAKPQSAVSEARSFAIAQAHPAHLHQVLQKPLQTITPRLEENHVRVSNCIPADLPPLSIDPQQLQCVYDNLLDNAVKHNPLGTEITLTAAIGADSEPACLRCEVGDNGVGLTAQQRDRLFQLYVRGLDNRHLTGIGLGLYQCYQIITAHGGKIGVTSEPGSGTQVWFTVPLAMG